MLKSLRLLNWTLVLCFLSCCHAGFVQTFALQNYNMSQALLEPFMVYVAVDAENQLMKILVNSQVRDHSNLSSTDVLVTDVDPSTNRYTTLHVDISFLGTQFISENVRLCDALAVKNTSAYRDSARYEQPPPETSTSSAEQSAATVPSWIPQIANSTHWRSKRWSPAFGNSTSLNNETSDISLSTSNATIEAFFSNSTGDLVTCPLYQNDSIVFYYQADISQYYDKYGSFSVTFSVFSNGPVSHAIGGARFSVTPSIEPRELERLLFYGVLVLYLAAYVINFFIIAMSPDQESQNPFLIEASAICNERLLNQLEANPRIILSYLQFALFMSGLDVTYPGFFKSLLGRIRWCALIGLNVLTHWCSLPLTSFDNVFISYNNNGLKYVALYDSNGYFRYSWPNFIICLVVWILIGLVSYQVYIALKVIAQRKNEHSTWKMFFGLKKEDVTDTQSTQIETQNHAFPYSWRTNAYAILGHVLREFMSTFAVPFLILTFYMIYSAFNFQGSIISFQSSVLVSHAFNKTIPYNFLTPWQMASSKALTDHPPPPPSSSNMTDIPQNGTQSGLPDLASLFYGNKSIPTASVALGIILIACWLILAFAFIAYYFFSVLFLFHPSFKKNVAKFYTSVKTILLWAYMYNFYKPEMVLAVIVDILGALFFLMVIAFLQNAGTTQVCLLFVTEFAKWAYLVIARPYYVSMSWKSLAFIMQTARLAITALNIAYIDEVDVTDSVRARIAYLQLLIHIFVIFVAMFYLIYCLGLTIYEMFKASRKRQLGEKDVDPLENASAKSLHSDFEFRQVNGSSDTLASATPPTVGTDGQLSVQSTNDDCPYDYYRSQSEKVLLALEHKEGHFEVCPTPQEEVDESDLFEESQVRTTEVDYTTRESDRIFQKYFSSHEMDPEMKQLWDQRDRNNNIPGNQNLKSFAKSSKTEDHFVMGLWRRVRPKEKKGFEVVGRAPIQKGSSASNNTST